MNTASRLGAFGAGLALAFGAAFGIGNAVGPTGSDPEPAHGGHGGEEPDAAPGATEEDDDHEQH